MIKVLYKEYLMGSHIILCRNRKLYQCINTITTKDQYINIKCWKIDGSNDLSNISNKGIETIEELHWDDNKDSNTNQMQSYIIAIITKESLCRIDMNYLMNSYKDINIELVHILHEDSLICYCILITMRKEDNMSILNDNNNYFDFIYKQFISHISKIKGNLNKLYSINCCENEAMDIDKDNKSNDNIQSNANAYCMFISSLIDSYIKDHELSINQSDLSIESHPKCPILNLNHIKHEDDIKMAIEDELIPIQSTSHIEIVDAKEDEDEEPIEDLDQNLFELPTHRRELEKINQINETNTLTSINNSDQGMTEIIPNFLYLGNYKNAKNITALKEKGITHIINCAADVCNNTCTSKGNNNNGIFINYLNYALRDSINENIESIFYPSFEFIAQCKESNGRILIHCYQGISRSVSIVIAYLIYSNHLTYDEAFNYVQSLRNIIDPNISFTFQLNLFEKRLHIERKGDQEVTLFSVGSFQRDMQYPLVCRLIYETITLNQPNLPQLYDEGVYLLTSPKENHILIGKNISIVNKEAYMNAVMKYYKLLVKYENCNAKEPIVLEQPSSQQIVTVLGFEFHFGFGTKGSNQYNIELSDSNYNKDSESKEIMSIMIKDVPVSYSRKGFFFYPNREVYGVLNLDDLTNEELVVACVDDEYTGKVIYIWEGIEVGLTEMEMREYVDYIKRTFFINGDNIVEIIEIPYEESEDFFKLL